ncbi:MAG: vitamin B12-dependent ribonucleotide reductase [Planctomycetota bacterium]|jgi:ribonucleoside-diphosphate reductase alpha chain
MIADPLAAVEWRLRPAGGGLAFEVEAPAGWSDRAVAVVASRYLREGRETSVRELIRRVGTELAAWVRDQGLGGAEVEGALLDLLVGQRGAFNSPVWFNVGVDERPQCSACFILSVEDSLASIMELARTEGLLFQRGSGAGTNLSTLRSAREPLSDGGTASGPVSFMRGYDAFAGVVKSGGRTRRAAKMQILDAGHPDVFDFVRSKAHEEKKAKALLAAGYEGGLDGEAYASVAFQNANLSVRVPDDFMAAVDGGGEWGTRAVTSSEVVERFPARDLLRAMAQAAWSCGDPGIQYADTIQRWNPCKAGGVIRASNPCSEYLFLDDTACNLASLNLLQYERADAFDVESFRADIGTLLRSMEAIVDRASYPTPRVEEMCRRYRPLGLGYANLGALLMASALPYDSDEGRSWAAAITALLTGEAYRVSVEMAKARGPFEAFAGNRESFLDVLESHREAAQALNGAPAGIADAARAAWDDVLAGAAKHGVRNAQVTLLAPTGTIAFLMDCDTTGIEPDLALVKYKHLVGGGTLRMVNRTVPRALARLGYAEEAVTAIEAHLEEAESIEDAPELRDEHIAVFDCAVPPPHGGRCIGTDGHLLMMAAVQPFLSGGISKTVNLPVSATVDDIEAIYLRGWKLGLKAVAVYREGSKGVQPMEAKDHCMVEECGVCE